MASRAFTDAPTGNTRRGRRAVALAVGALLALAVFAAGMAGCGSVSSGSGGTSGGSSGGSSASPTDTGTWQTVSESSGSSVSNGGTNNDTSQQTTSVNGAYRVMAACEGGGSLAIQLNPGGAVNVQCTPARQEPVRVAGSDSAPPGGTLSMTITRNGNITSSDVLVQVRR
ncbi:MAG TPA: hypothetical protein VF120_03230 [Ktedonobacterales bacterium]